MWYIVCTCGNTASELEALIQEKAASDWQLHSVVSVPTSVKACNVVFQKEGIDDEDFDEDDADE